EIRREGAPRLGQRPLPELAGAAHQVFPQPRLALVNPQARRRPQRLPGVLLLWQPLLVEAVTRLVHRAGERVEEAIVAKARCQACVARTDSLAEGVGGNIETAGGEVEAHAL